MAYRYYARARPRRQFVIISISHRVAGEFHILLFLHSLYAFQNAKAEHPF